MVRPAWTARFSSGAHIKPGRQDKLFMGNLDARRDWNYAKEYAEAMWLMLQQPEPDDYVIATNETHTIRECLEVAFGRVGLDWQKYVEIDPRYYRPAEVELLIGDDSKAKRKMGWEPKTKFKDLTMGSVLTFDTKGAIASHPPPSRPLRGRQGRAGRRLCRPPAARGR